MKLFSLLSISAFFLLCTTTVHAASYYVDPSGSDGNPGTSSGSAWQTVNKVNTSTFAPGDSILFKRGGIWREKLTIPSGGSVGNPVTYGAYGNGSNPILDESTPVTSWSNYSGNIYVADVASPVGRVFVDNVAYNIAHYPNTGYETITSDTGHVSVISSSFSPPNADLVGAGIMVRPVSWFLEGNTISSYDAGTHTLNLGGYTGYPIQSGFGFYVTNKLWMLDSPGEWYYDTATSKLYLWIADSTNPASHVITTTQSSSIGIAAVNKANVTVQDIDVRNTGEDAVAFDTTSHIILERMTISYAGRYAIQFYGSSSDNLIIRNNTLNKTARTGVKLYQLPASSILIADNTITDTGMLGSPIMSETGIDVEYSTNVMVERNTITNSAYIGIRFEGDNNTVQHNVVRNSCLILDDCAGIYMGWYDGIGNQIKGNFVSDSIGNYAGTPAHITGAHGIYIDLGTNNVTISDNTISNTDRGVFLHVTSNNTVTGNTTYQSRISGMSIMEDGYVVEGTVHGNTITGNTFLNGSFFYPSALYEGFEGSTAFGTYNNNKYFGTYFGHPVSQTVTATQTNYSLPNWSTASGQDSLSSDIGSYFSVNKIGSYDGSSVVTNSTFDSDVAGWSQYSPDSSATLHWVASCGLDEGCLHATTNAVNSITISNTYNLVIGTIYEVSFSLISPTNASGNVVVRRAGDPWTAYAIKSFIGSGSRQDISFTFVATENNLTMLNFDTNIADYYLDNVKLRPITLHNINDDSILITNPTAASANIDLGGDSYCDISNHAVTSPVTLSPYTSQVLLNCFNNSDGTCNNHETNTTAPSDCVNITDEGTSAGLDAPYKIGVNTLDTSGIVRVYSNGKFRGLSSPSGVYANLAVVPESGFNTSNYSIWMEISNLSWQNNGYYHKHWVETSTTLGDTPTIHTVGDLRSGNYYFVYVDSVLNPSLVGTLGTVCIRGVCRANSDGKISFIYTGGYSTHTFDVSENVDYSATPTSPWTQTDWSGGAGQINWGDPIQFFQSTGMNISDQGQLTMQSPEKFVNFSFENGLTSWSTTPTYLVNDQFTDSKLAGSVNGTAADPGPGTRQVTDTNSKISVDSGVLKLLTGGAAYDGIWYGSQSRTVGKLVSAVITPADTAGIFALGWDNDTTGTLTSSLKLNTSSGVEVVENNSSPIHLGVYAGNTQYRLASLLRSSGNYWFIQGGDFANWTLLWVSKIGAGSVHPSFEVGNTTSAGTLDSLQVQDNGYLPTPLVYDTFTRTSGSIGSSESTGPDGQTTPSLSWTGGTISNNKNVIMPTTGEEKVVNGTFDTDTTGWTPDNATLTSVAGGVSGNALQISRDSGDYQRTLQTLDLLKNTWYLQTSDIKSGTSGNEVYIAGIYTGVNWGTYAWGITSPTWATKVSTYRPTTDWSQIFLHKSSATPGTMLYDNVSVKPLDPASLFSTVNTTVSSVMADVDITLAGSFAADGMMVPAGLVLNLDSTSTPNNYVVAYYDGSSVYFEKVLAGVYSDLFTPITASYVAGGTLRVIKDDLTYRVYYNSTFIGEAVLDRTIDAAIIGNTRHGIFSTYSGNSFDNFTLFARGNSNEYQDLAVQELGVTADTTHTHSGATGARLTSGVNSNIFYQNVNLGTTNLYSLSAYVYTNGSPVTANDCQLWSSGSPVPTTYTPDPNNNGWYLLTGDVVGATSSLPYGLSVKSGKTIWADDLSLKPKSAISTLLSSVYDAGDITAWGNLTYDATSSGSTSVAVKVITWTTPSVPTDFSGCTAIPSGSALTAGGCDHGGEYVRYQITLNNPSLESSPIFSRISIGFTPTPQVASPTPQSNNSSNNSGGGGGSSNSCNSDTPEGVTTILSALKQGSHEIRLNFASSATPIDHFAIEYGTKPGVYQFGADNIGNKDTKSYTVGYLKGSTTYYFRIRADNGCRDGDWSQEVSGTTKGGILVSRPPTKKSTASKVTPTTISSINAVTTPALAPTPTPTPSAVTNAIGAIQSFFSSIFSAASRLKYW